MGGKGKVVQTMYTQVSKCKNNKIKGEKKKIILWRRKIACFYLKFNL
jgi:hypothetical protein